MGPGPYSLLVERVWEPRIHQYRFQKNTVIDKSDGVYWTEGRQQDGAGMLGRQREMFTFQTSYDSWCVYTSVVCSDGGLPSHDARLWWH